MVQITTIASNDQVVIFDVTGVPHASNAYVGMEYKVQELINQHQFWSFNRYKCVGNPYHELVIFHK